MSTALNSIYWKGSELTKNETNKGNVKVSIKGNNPVTVNINEYSGIKRQQAKKLNQDKNRFHSGQKFMMKNKAGYNSINDIRSGKTGPSLDIQNTTVRQYDYTTGQILPVKKS